MARRQSKRIKLAIAQATEKMSADIEREVANIRLRAATKDFLDSLVVADKEAVSPTIARLREAHATAERVNGAST